MHLHLLVSKSNFMHNVAVSSDGKWDLVACRKPQTLRTPQFFFTVHPLQRSLCKQDTSEVYQNMSTESLNDWIRGKTRCSCSNACHLFFLLMLTKHVGNGGLSNEGRFNFWCNHKWQIHISVRKTNVSTN